MHYTYLSSFVQAVLLSPPFIVYDSHINDSSNILGLGFEFIA